MPTPELRSTPLWVRAAAAVIARAPAARYRMAHALGRFGGSPFLRRLPPALGGYTYHCDIRDTVAREVCFTGRYEPQETQLAARVLRTGMTAVDVGANWGYFTLAAAHWVGPTGRVIAFEPEPRLFAMARGNVSRNGLAHVAVHPFAVAGEAGTLRLAVFDDRCGNWGTSRIAASGAIECRAVALDDHLDAEGVGAVDLLKVDVEGGEIDVIAGMRRGLASGRYRYLLLECHPDALSARGSSVEACVSPLLDAGYRVWTVVHNPKIHRRAAERTLSAGELLGPFSRGAAMPDAWPHFFFAAPRAADPA